MGSNALKCNTIAVRNIAIGTNALSRNTSSSNNTAVGYLALECNNGGTNNTAIGVNALSLNTTGIDNTSFGSLSLQYNTTGNNNTALGRYSLRCNTTGASNTAVGFCSLRSNTTAVCNTAIGINAGSCMTTGACNTFIGGFNGAGFETQSGNIFISDGAGNVRIFGCSTNGTVGVGTTTPNTSYKFFTCGSIGASGDIVAFVSSDSRLKSNITAIKNPIEKIKQIGGYEFDWNEKQKQYKGHDIGVIAQEIEKILPEIVTTRDDGFKAVKYDRIVSLLIEAIKELEKRVSNIENK